MENSIDFATGFLIGVLMGPLCIIAIIKIRDYLQEVT